MVTSHLTSELQSLHPFLDITGDLLDHDGGPNMVHDLIVL